MWRLLLPCLVAACTADGPTVDFDDTDTVLPTETDAGTSACSGQRTFDFGDAPESFAEVPTTWTSQDADWRAEPGRTGYDVDPEDGCIAIAPGALALDILPTGCAMARAEVDLTDRCGPSCTEVFAAADRTRVATTANTERDTATTLRVAPADPFSDLVVASLDALVCEVRVWLVDVPDSLKPPDTGAPF